MESFRLLNDAMSYKWKDLELSPDISFHDFTLAEKSNKSNINRLGQQVRVDFEDIKTNHLLRTRRTLKWRLVSGWFVILASTSASCSLLSLSSPCWLSSFSSLLSMGNSSSFWSSTSSWFSTRSGSGPLSFLQCQDQSLLVTSLTFV